MRIVVLAPALLLVACHRGAEPDTLDCTGAVDDNISLVLGLDWTPDSSGASWAEFGETEDYGQVTPTFPAGADGDPVHVDLVGNAPGTTIYWRGVTETADGPLECHGSTRTGDLPSRLTTFEVSVDTLDVQAPGEDAAAGNGQAYLVGGFYQFGGESAQLVAIRRDGTVVWYYEGEAAGTSLDLHYARDGSGLLYNMYPDGFGSADAHIDEVSLTGDVLGSWPTPGAHHMFTELPDGTLTYQAIDTRSYTDPESGESELWTGDKLVEVARDGTATDVFSVWDWITPTQNAHTGPNDPYPGYDWTQGNLVTFDDRDGSPDGRYLLSMANAADVIDIDRADMSVIDIYGLDGVLADPVFDYQHGPNWLDNGNLLMFMTDDDGSGAIEYDVSDGTPREVWRHGFDDTALALGQAERLPNGNTYINYGALLALEEVTPDGEVVWAAKPTFHGVTAFPGQFTWTSNLYTGGE